MIRYNRKKIDQASYDKALKLWIGKGLLEPGEVTFPGKRETPYRKYDLVKRIGLYLLTMLAVQSVVGFFYLLIFDALGAGEHTYKIILILTGIASYAALEKMITNSNMYKQGTDDALLHTSFGYTSFGLLTCVDINPDHFWGLLIASLILLPLALFSAIRYADSLMSLIAVTLILVIPLLCVALVNMQLLFFSALIMVPLGIFLLTRIRKLDTFKYHYWKSCFMVSRFVVCGLMYASINLFVIRSLANSLMGVVEIPLSVLFLVLTVLFPFAFIVTGIKQKQKYLVHAGLFLLIPTVSTIRYYYSVMPAELALMLAGLALTLTSYFAIRYLRKAETPYTFEEDQDDEDLKNIESISIIQQFGHKESVINEGTNFGGGDFGGAGSGGKY